MSVATVLDREARLRIDVYCHQRIRFFVGTADAAES